MGYLIEWDNEDKTVLLQQYTDDPVKDDLYALAAKSAEMLSAYEHEVHLIIDERKADFIISATDMRYLEKKVPKNQGVVVLVIEPEGIKYRNVMLGMSKGIAPQVSRQPYFVTTIYEARTLLQENFGVKYPPKTPK